MLMFHLVTSSSLSQSTNQVISLCVTYISCKFSFTQFKSSYVYLSHYGGIWLGMSNGFHFVQTHYDIEIATILLLHIHSHFPYSKLVYHYHTSHPIVIHFHLSSKFQGDKQEDTFVIIPCAPLFQGLHLRDEKFESSAQCYNIVCVCVSLKDISYS